MKTLKIKAFKGWEVDELNREIEYFLIEHDIYEEDLHNLDIRYVASMGSTYLSVTVSYFK